MSARLPVVFVGHGSPTNAIEENAYVAAWRALGQSLPRPRAILCISAHWETRGGAAVGATAAPETIHDFYGFPPEMYRLRYPAPGAPALAERVAALLGGNAVALDPTRGLDHGAWSVLLRMYPAADVPVAQLSLNRDLSPAEHYALGALLRPLRDEGVLLLGSGNLVHHLGVVRWNGAPYDWAETFDQQAAALMVAGDHAPLLDYATLGRPALLSINSAEHYLPLLYVLGASEPGEAVQFACAEIVHSSISMRMVIIGKGAS